jgi:hypothetical protein
VNQRIACEVLPARYRQNCKRVAVGRPAVYFVTTTLIVTVWVMEPLVKVTVTVYDPVEVFLPAATVKNTVAVPPEESVRLVELRETVGGCGAFGVIDVDMLIVPLKPFRLASVRMETAIVEFVWEPF